MRDDEPVSSLYTSKTYWVLVIMVSFVMKILNGELFGYIIFEFKRFSILYQGFTVYSLGNRDITEEDAAENGGSRAEND